MELYKLDERKPTFTWLLYADPGNCKTSAATTMALHEDMSPVLHANVDGGILTIRDMDGIPKDSVSIVDINRMSEVEELFRAIHAKKDGYEGFKSVVLDNATEIAGMALEEQVAGNMLKTSRGGKQRTSLDDAWIEDRGAAGNQCARVFRWFRDLPGIHVVYTCHVRREFPKKGDMPDTSKPPLSVLPDLAPSLSRRMRGYVDNVWYLMRTPDQTAVKVLCDELGAYYAKTRGDKIKRQLGHGFIWPHGFPLLPAFYDLVVNGTAWPLEPIVPPAPEPPATVPERTEDQEDQEGETSE